MKKYYLFYLLAVTLFISSYGSDDWTIDDWVRTWSGQLECNDDDLNELLTLEVSKVDENTLLYDDGTDAYEMPFNGCSVVLSELQQTLFGDAQLDIRADINGD